MQKNSSTLAALLLLGLVVASMAADVVSPVPVETDAEVSVSTDDSAAAAAPEEKATTDDSLDKEAELADLNGMEGEKAHGDEQLDAVFHELDLVDGEDAKQDAPHTSDVQESTHTAVDDLDYEGNDDTEVADNAKTFVNNLSIFEEKIRSSHIRQCRGVMKALNKRDDEEARKQDKELQLISIVMEQLKELDLVGKKQSQELQEDVLARVMSSLDAGRDYSEVNGPGGIKDLLKGLRKRMLDQLKEMRLETKQNLEHCRSRCRYRRDQARMNLEQARGVVRLRRHQLKQKQKQLRVKQGQFQERLKNYLRVRKAHDKAEAVRIKEIVLIKLLLRKVQRFKKINDVWQPGEMRKKVIKKGNGEADIEAGEEQYLEQDQRAELLSDVKTMGVEEGLAAVISELSMTRPLGNILKVENILNSLLNKIRGERQRSLANLRRLHDQIKRIRQRIEELKIKVQVAHRRLRVAQQVKNRALRVLNRVRRWCVSFLG